MLSCTIHWSNLFLTYVCFAFARTHAQKEGILIFPLETVIKLSMMMELLPPFFGPISHAEKNCVRFAMHRVKPKGQAIDEGAHLSSGQNMPFNLDEA